MHGKLKTLTRGAIFLLPLATPGCKNERIDDPPPAKREVRIDAPGVDVSVDQDRAAMPAAGSGASWTSGLATET